MCKVMLCFITMLSFAWLLVMLALLQCYALLKLLAYLTQDTCKAMPRKNAEAQNYLYMLLMIMLMFVVFNASLDQSMKDHAYAVLRMVKCEDSLRCGEGFVLKVTELEIQC